MDAVVREEEKQEKIFFDAFYEELRKMGLDEELDIDFEEWDSESYDPWGLPSSHGESLTDLSKSEILDLAKECATSSVLEIKKIIKEEKTTK